MLMFVSVTKKMQIKFLVSREEVETLAGGDGSGRVQR